MAIGRRALGPAHPELSISLSKLGELLHRMGDLVGSRLHLTEALAILEQRYGVAHPGVANTLFHFGVVCAAEGDSAAARRYFERALSIYRSFYDESSDQVQYTLGWLKRCGEQ